MEQVHINLIIVNTVGFAVIQQERFEKFLQGRKIYFRSTKKPHKMNKTSQKFHRSTLYLSFIFIFILHRSIYPSLEKQITYAIILLIIKVHYLEHIMCKKEAVLCIYIGRVITINYSIHLYIYPRKKGMY